MKQHLLFVRQTLNVECSINIATVMRSFQWVRTFYISSIPGVCGRDKGSGHSRTAGHRCSPSWRYTLALSASQSIFDSSWALKVRRGQGGRITRKASPISECVLTVRMGWSPAFYCSRCRPEPSRCPHRNETPGAPGECQISANAAVTQET